VGAGAFRSSRAHRCSSGHISSVSECSRIPRRCGAHEDSDYTSSQRRIGTLQTVSDASADGDNAEQHIPPAPTQSPELYPFLDGVREGGPQGASLPPRRLPGTGQLNRTGGARRKARDRRQFSALKSLLGQDRGSSGHAPPPAFDGSQKMAIQFILSMKNTHPMPSPKVAAITMQNKPPFVYLDASYVMRGMAMNNVSAGLVY